MSERRLKPGWKMVRFGDVVRLNTERVADPLAAGIERYVGLEHLTPEDLHIHSWGLVSEGTTFINYFKPGQVLFGKRRAYQRKVALSDFEGVCSGDIYVFEPKNDRLLPGLLPFICQTDVFFEYAVGTSAGSLSPRTNWEQLAKFEFALPPMEEQLRVADLMGVFISTSNSLRELISSITKTEESFLYTLFGKYFDDKKSRTRVEINKLAYIQTGVAKGRSPESGVTVEYPYIGVGNVQDGFLDLTEVGKLTVETNLLERYLLHSGDVLITEGGDPDKLGRGVVWKNEIENCIHQNHIFAIRPYPEKLDSEFLAVLIRSVYAKQYFLSCAKRTSNLATINKHQVESFLVPLINIDGQRKLVDRWKQLRAAQDEANARLYAANQFFKSLVNKVLPP